MATSFTHTQRYDADPATVMAMLRDPQFVELKCARTGSLETTASATDGADGGVTLVNTRLLPADVPGPAKKFVGDTLNVTETQEWSAAAGDGSRRAQATVDFGAPLVFTATMTLAPSGGGTEVTVDGSFKASVPFVGGTVEKSAAEKTHKYLDVEQAVGAEWLTTH